MTMLGTLRASLTRLVNQYGIGLIVYGGVSVVSAITEWAIFIAALRSAGPVLAAVIGFLGATMVNFILSHFFVFRSNRSVLEALVLVLTMSAIAFVANFTIFYGLITFAGINLIYAKVIGTCAGFFFNYGARQFFIFSKISRFPAITKLIARNAGDADGEMTGVHADRGANSGEARASVPSNRSPG